MSIHPLDVSIIILYIVVIIAIGLWISKRASRDIKSYFLGGNTMPWYILGVSNASGMFDITGTMWLVYLLFVYGLKGVFIPWLWPVFNQVFLMVYLSVWLRRSNVMTGAEWIKSRFGTGTGAQLSHIIIVIYALVSVIGFLAYGFQGIGKFSSNFLPWDLSPKTYGLIFMVLTSLYVVKGGMFSVVVTELLQFGIMTIAAIAIGIIAMIKVSPDALAAAVPAGWKNIFFGWHLNLDWSGLIDSVNTKTAADGYSLFGLFFIMMLFKGVLISVAGPAPNYDMQRILATRSPAEAGKMSGFVSVVLFFPRFMMIAGLTVLALVFYSPELRAMGGAIDFEMILPYAISNFVPVGLLGILLAGLLAAFMSTFAATVNAAPAYIVNDIYKRYIRPDADKKTYVRMSYIISLVVIVVGIGFGFLTESINSVTLWIVSALWGGYTASNVLKWHWWRFNGHGYFWGMVAGIASSMIYPALLPDVLPLYVFPLILVTSLIGCILGTFLTPPDDIEVLKDFYRTVRPWGFWKPIHDLVVAEDPAFQPNRAFKRDMVNVAVGIVWQTALVACPIYLVIKDFVPFVVGMALVVLTTVFLKFNWWDKLED